MDNEQLVKRLQLEDCAMKSLRTIYPYGLNEKAKAKDKVKGSEDHLNIGCLFPPLPRKGPSVRRERKNRNNRNEKIFTKESFFEQLKTYITEDIKSSFFNIRITLNKLRKKTLKSIYSHIILEKASLF